MPLVVTFNRKALAAPYAMLAAIAIIAVWQHEWWLFLGIPLVYLGWVCAAPNLNLADGCLPQLTLIGGSCRWRFWVEPSCPLERRVLDHLASMLAGDCRAVLSA